MALRSSILLRTFSAATLLMVAVVALGTKFIRPRTEEVKPLSNGGTQGYVSGDAQSDSHSVGTVAKESRSRRPTLEEAFGRATEERDPSRERQFVALFDGEPLDHVECRGQLCRLAFRVLTTERRRSLRARFDIRHDGGADLGRICRALVYRPEMESAIAYCAMN
jgi:hypothetical protein